MTVPSEVPAELFAGDTWNFTREYGDYPSPTWTATIYFEFGGSQFSQAGVQYGSTSSHSFTISAATSADKRTGRYKYWVRVTDGTSHYTVEEGWLEVKPNPAATGSRDHRSWARRALDAVEATIEDRATDGQLAMTIGGRSISRIPLAELKTLRTELRQEVRTEEQRGQSGRGRNIKARFQRV